MCDGSDMCDVDTITSVLQVSLTWARCAMTGTNTQPVLASMGEQGSFLDDVTSSVDCAFGQQSPETEERRGLSSTLG